MKPLSLLALALLQLPTALAAIGGRCSGDDWGLGCICLDTADCHRRGGNSNPGRPGHWTCPHDPDNVQGCWISGCVAGGATVCAWRDECSPGQILPNPTCPGGNDFVCCRFS